MTLAHLVQWIVVPLLLLAGILRAAQSSSADFLISADVLDAGGSRSVSQNFTHQGSLGGVVGRSSVSLSPVAKHGFIGQLYEIVGLRLVSPQTTFAEGASFQIGAETVFDDETTRSEAPNSVSWSVAFGPLVIDLDGQLNASAVYQNEQGRVRGDFGGRSASLAFSVLDVDLDNFASYGSDGIADSWQIGFFGLPPNDLAAPGEDPDGDRQNNLFEFLALLDPNDPASVFELAVRPVSGQPLRREIVFSPISTQRTYTVLGSRNLESNGFQPISGVTTREQAGERTVIETMASTDATRFYIIEISID